MNVRFKYSTVFSAGIYYDNTFLVNNYRVQISMLTGTMEPDDHDVGMERVKYFIHRCLANSVFINSDNHEQCLALLSANLKVCTLPTEPFDQAIIIALYSKLNAILEDRILVTDIELSSEIGDNIWFMHCEDETVGPFEDAGWWQDSEPVQCNEADFVVDDKILALTKTTSWKELDLAWDDNDGQEPDNRVLLVDFQKK